MIKLVAKSIFYNLAATVLIISAGHALSYLLG